MASSTGIDFGAGFGDNLSLSSESMDSALSRLDAAIQESEIPLIPDDDSTNDTAEPTEPETVEGRRRRGSMLDEHEDGEGDGEDEGDDDELESESKKKGRKRRHHKSSLLNEDDKDNEDGDDEGDEDDEEAKEDKDAETEAKKRRCRNLNAIASVAEESFIATGRIDPGLEHFVRVSGLMSGAQDTSIGTESLFSGLLQAGDASFSVESLQRAAADASEDLTDHYRRIRAGL